MQGKSVFIALECVRDGELDRLLRVCIPSAEDRDRNRHGDIEGDRQQGQRQRQAETET